MSKIASLDLRKNETPQQTSTDTQRLAVTDMGPRAYNQNYSYEYYDGDKFYNGFGDTKLFIDDYWTLRNRSEQLFKENLYAKGLIRRLITNEINTGLTPEFNPDESIIGVPEDFLQDWTEDGENRFALWGQNRRVCDFYQKDTFAEIQRKARLEALVSGDVLVVLRANRKTRLPAVQLISGARVRTPVISEQNIREGNDIEQGVEYDRFKRVTAYWVLMNDGKHTRVPAYGERSGKLVSWLVFGVDKRLENGRGYPLLTIILQSLKDMDRYRDAATRKAVVNSMFAAVVTKSEDKIGTLPGQGGAITKEDVTVTDSDGSSRDFNIAKYLPGAFVDELQTGEDIQFKGGEGTDINFGPFQEAILSAIAWVNEIPPEILILAFTNNYSASQAAINEFKIYLNKFWHMFGEDFCQPIKNEWLISSILLGTIQADGFLNAWRNPQAHDVFGAWTASDWYGSIKPSTDVVKQARGAQMLIAEGLSTHAREARGITGTKFSKNIKRLRRENELKAEAMRPLLELEREFGNSAVTQALREATAAIEEHTFTVIEGAADA